MGGYFIDENTKKNLQYYDIQISNQIGLTDAHQIEIFYNLVGPLGISRDEEFKEDTEKLQLNSENMAMLNIVCEIQLLIYGRGEKRLLLYPSNDARFCRSGSSIFSKSMSQNEAEELINWIKDDPVKINWSIAGYLLPLDLDNKCPPVLLVRNNWTENHKTYLPPSFKPGLVSSLNLNSIFIDKFPISFPEELANLKNPLTSELEKIRNDLNNTVTNLQNAVMILRKSTEPLQYIDVMNNVKRSLDTLSKYKKYDEYGKELMVKPGIISNSDDPKGAYEASEEFMKSLFQSIDTIYQMASKPAHLVTLTTQKRFDFNPSQSEAILVTELALGILKYLLARLSYHVRHSDRNKTI